MTEPGPVTREPPPYLAATVVAVVIFLIYLATLAPTTAFWDTSEYIAAAYTLGIPHPPGNPLFTVLAHAWGALPLASTYAVRINLFAAFTGAAAAGLWFLVADRWMRDVVPARWPRLAAAAAGVLVGATSWTVWNQSTVNEKVYTVSLLSTALVLWVGVHWADDKPGAHRDRWLVMIAYLVALNSTNHMMGVLAAPAVATYVLLTDPNLLLKPWVLWLGLALVLAVSGQWAVVISGPLNARVALALGVAALAIYTAFRDSSEFRRPILYVGIAAVAIGVSLNYIFLPIRAAHFPPINEGEPTTWQALSDVLSRRQYGKPSVFLRQADFVSQVGNYLQYFRWQFARDWGEAGQRLTTLIFSALGFWGALALWRRDRRAFWASTTLLVTLTVALIFYLNFKYGWSYPVDPSRGNVPREVRERDYFFLISFASFGLWVAVGLGAALRATAQALSQLFGGPVRWAPAMPLLAVALIPLAGNRLSAPRAHETTARDFAVDLLESVEPYSVLITAGDNDTFPLWYAQEVEGVRQDVTLANLSLMNTTWHLKQIRRRVTPEFEPDKAISLWRGQTWTRPTTPALALTEAQIDELPEAQQVPRDRGIQFDSLTIRFGQDVLFLSDIAAIFLIRDNLGKRPIYFAWSAGSMPDNTLGLTPYLVTEGMVRRLNPTPVKEGGDIVLSRGIGYMDIKRTRFLLDSAYHWQAVARNRPTGWVDKPSASILNLYALIYGAAGSSYRALGDSTFATKADSIATLVDAQISR